MGFSFQSEKLSDAIVFSLNGYVEKDSAKSVRLKVEEMAKKGELLFILDFTNSPIVNSMAIGELYDMVSLYISIPKIRFFFCGLSSTCQIAFKTVGIFHHVKEAANKFDAVSEAGSKK